MKGIPKNAIFNQPRHLGCAHAEHQNRFMPNLTTKRVQCDSTWAFCSRERKVSADMKGPSHLAMVDVDRFPRRYRANLKLEDRQSRSIYGLDLTHESGGAAIEEIVESLSCSREAAA
jgi:hypothetical protein